MTFFLRVIRKGRDKFRRNWFTIVIKKHLLKDHQNRRKWVIKRRANFQSSNRSMIDKKKCFFFVTSLQLIGASKVVWEGKEKAYVKRKEEVLVKRGKNVKLQRKVLCQNFGCCSFENSLTSLTTRSRPIMSFISPSFSPNPLPTRIAQI